MNVLSLSGYARHRKQHGLSGGTLRAVQKALAAGRITAHPDGRIDLRRADAQWQRNTSVTKIHRKPTRAEAVPPSQILSSELDVDAVPADLEGEQLAEMRWIEWDLLDRLREYAGSVSGTLATVLDWIVYGSGVEPDGYLPELSKDKSAGRPELEAAAKALLALLEPDEEDEPPLAAGGGK